MEARRLRCGETRWQCLVPACEHEFTTKPTEHVLQTRCENCGSPFVQPVGKRRSPVRTTIGGNERADLGLALLLEAQENSTIS